MADQRRSKSNTWFQKQNHGRLKKSEVNKEFILDAGVTRLQNAGFTINDGLGVAVSIGGGFVVTGTELTAAVSNLDGGETLAYQWQDDGVNITGATAATYTPTIGVDSVAVDSDIRCLVTVDGGDPIASNTRQLIYAAVAAAAPLDLSFSEDSAITPVDLEAAFTLNGNTVTITAVDTLPTGLSISANDLTGTPTTVTADANYTIQAEDAYGRTVTNEIAIEITEIITPTITSNSFDDSSDTWSVSTDAPNDGNYHWARFADGTTGITPDGAGGWSSAPLQSGTIAVGANPSTLQIQEGGTTGVAYELFLYQRSAGGLDSNVLTTGYVADNTAPVVNADGSTDVAGDTITLPISETVTGTPAVGDFTINGVSAGTPTIDSVTVSGTTITIEISGNLIANGDTVTVDYAQGVNKITDAHNNEMASFTGQAVTNNVPSAGISIVGTSGGTMAADAGQTETTYALPAGLSQGDYVEIALATDDAWQNGSAASGNNNWITPATTDGWTILDGGAGQNPGHLVLAKVMGATPDTTFRAFPGTTNQACYAAVAFSGVDQATPQDVVLTDAGGATGMPAPPANTSATVDALSVLTGHLDDDSVVMTAPAGWTLARAETCASASVAIATKAVPVATTTETPAAFGGGFSDAWQASHQMLRPA